MHLTNYSLNKQSDKYQAPEGKQFLISPSGDFMIGDSGSKRLLSTLYKYLEQEGVDITALKEKINDTVRKCIISLEPFLIHSYHCTVDYDHGGTKNFQLLGIDVLIDSKLNAWLMEVNSNPSLSMFLEREGDDEKIVSEIDKYVKA